MSPPRAVRALPLLALLLLPACDDMIHQDKQDAYASSQTAPGKVPGDRVQWRERRAAPPPVSMALLERGQERFRAFCTPCHAELGDGGGRVGQRGFWQPPSYGIARLRDAPVAHFYDVMTNGYGAMYSFAARVPPSDRWAIAAYIRALQASQDQDPAALAPEQHAQLP